MGQGKQVIHLMLFSMVIYSVSHANAQLEIHS